MNLSGTGSMGFWVSWSSVNYVFNIRKIIYLCLVLVDVKNKNVSEEKIYVPDTIKIVFFM